MSDKLTTCLWFDKGEARKAAEFYASVFPDSRVGTSIGPMTILPPLASALSFALAIEGTRK